MPARVTLLVLVGLVAGCAAQRSAAPQVPSAGSEAAQAPATAASVADAKASWYLDQIEPVPRLPPTTAPTTSSARPPIEALQLYARARDALAGGNRFTAISMLEKAISLDPDSAELHRTLARAHQAAGRPDKAIDSLRRACDIDPTDGRNQTALGRLYLLRNDPVAAMERLRLALQTRDYADDEATATVTDYFLARALQQQGYDRAALDQYEKLLARLEHPALALRSDRELTEWIARPEAIWGDVARLYERRGQYAQALDLWREVAQHDPEDLDARSHVVNTLLALDRDEDALGEAADAVRRTGASLQSIELLRDTAKRTGKQDAVYDELRRVQRQRPEDRAVLFTLVDLLKADGRDAEAERVLAEAARQRWDPEIVRRLCRVYSDRHRGDEAAKMIIEASAARPGDTPQLLELFQDLLRPLRRDSLRVSTLRKLEVSSDAEAAKQYFVACAALVASRNATMREALDQSVRAQPSFPPALLLQMQLIWRRDDPARRGQQAEESQQLIDRAARSGVPGLADSLRGVMLQRQGQRDQAIAALEAAVKAHDPSPESGMLLAQLRLDMQEHAKFEQAMWRVISDHPEYEEAYQRLILYHLSPGLSGGGINPAAARQVLDRWLSGDPSSVSARMILASLLSQRGQTQEALRVAGELVRQNPADPAVLQQAEAISVRANALPQHLQLLEELLAKSPDNFAVALDLVRNYSGNQKPDDVARVIERVRAAAADDARTMALVAQLYNSVEQKDKYEAALEESVRLDPGEPGPNNDLGYTWVDAGKNLDRAETMIRRAVEAEPDNPSFLDSLGWVLYKRGRFDQARQHLEQAVAAQDAVDAVVLDHLGDTLYRLNDGHGARLQWLLAMQRSNAQGRDQSDVRAAAEAKLRQQELGQTVDVAPTVGEALAKPVQAQGNHNGSRE